MGLVAGLTAQSAGILFGILTGARLLVIAALQELLLAFVPLRPPPPSPIRHLLPLIVLGEPGVGKTSAIQLWLHGSCLAAGPWDPGHSIRGASCMQLHSGVVGELDGRDCAVQVWETAGMEERKACGSQFFSRAAGFLLLYEVSRGGAHQKLGALLAELRGYLVGTVASTAPIAALGICKSRQGDMQGFEASPHAVVAESSSADSAVRRSAKQLCASEAIPLFVMSDAADTATIEEAFRHVAAAAAGPLKHNSQPAR